MINLLVFLNILLIAISVPTLHGYDPLDPDGKIIIKWDLLLSSPGHHDVQVTLVNKQEYRHVEKPGWKLSWHWKHKEVIWDMTGAETIDQGNCSAFAKGGNLPHCCLRRPTVVDLLPGAPLNSQVSNCCRGGFLTSISQDRSKHVSAFKMTIGTFPDDFEDDPLVFNMPYNFDIGVPGYGCGNATSVTPTKINKGKGRHKTQALATWEAECTYSQFRSSHSPKCCVSLSAFYSQKIVPCPTCSCSCSSNSHCVKDGKMPSYIEQKHDPLEELPPVVQCTNHNCPIHIHWHVKVNYREYWRVKITATNLNIVKNYTDWNLVVQHPNLKSVQQVFSFMYKSLTPYHHDINNTGVFWGIQFYNDVLLQAGKSGNVQSELLLKKDPEDFTFREGWAFPWRILFNGDECVMPSPDDYPKLPRSSAFDSSSSSFAAVTISFVTIVFGFLLAVFV